MPLGCKSCIRDVLGNFNLPAVPGDMPVIVTHPQGLLMTTAADARKDSRLRLQPFGRVEGALLSEGKPKPGGNVSISLITETHELNWSRSAVSDQDGQFVLTNLPAGEYQLVRVFYPRRPPEGGFATAPSHQKILTVKAGETVQLQYGGEGRAVIGQAVSENPAIAVDWLNENEDDSLELVRPSAAGGLKNSISESLGLGPSAAEQMKAEREKRSYHLEFEEDGSFRAEDVPPGNYELRIKVTKLRPSGEERFLKDGEALGSLARKVTIPPGKEPFDLGRQIVAVKGEPSAAPKPF